MKTFLTIAALLSWLFGGMLLWSPAAFYAPTGIILTPLTATLAQAHGATLVGLGVINWMARGAEGRGLQAVLAGNLVVQILSFAVAYRTMIVGAGAAAYPAFAIHTVLGACFAFFLAKTGRTTS